MNLKKLKTQQEAFQVHLSTQKDLGVVWKAFNDGYPEFKTAIIQAFAQYGVQAVIYSDLPHPKVKAPPSTNSVFIDVCHELRFDEAHLQSVFTHVPSVQPKMPMALLVEFRAGNSIHISRIWWHGPSDNERLAAVVVDMFQGKRGPTDVGHGSCFVATVVFGERSEEVAILRKWRDTRLSKSITGRALVKAYYRFGPYCADVVQRNALARRPITAVLVRFVNRLSHN